MNRKLISLVAAAAFAATSPAAVALAQVPAPQSQARAAAGPTVAASVAGIRRTAPASTTAAPAARQLGAGRNVALMVVGGAALIIGAIIGGTAGVLIAVGGAVVGLYGLYNYVQ